MGAEFVDVDFRSEVGSQFRPLLGPNQKQRVRICRRCAAQFGCEELRREEFDVPIQVELQPMQRPMADGNEADGRIAGEQRFQAIGQAGHVGCRFRQGGERLERCDEHEQAERHPMDGARVDLATGDEQIEAATQQERQRPDQGRELRS